MNKSYFVNSLADACNEHHHYCVYLVVVLSMQYKFIDVADAAFEVLKHGFDAFTVGDYLKLST